MPGQYAQRYLSDTLESFGESLRENFKKSPGELRETVENARQTLGGYLSSEYRHGI